MENTELARLIINDWTAARPFLEAMSLQERDELILPVIAEYGSNDPTEDAALALGKFTRCLHFDKDIVNSLWTEGRGNLSTPVHGAGPMLAWNMCARTGLKHATLFHKYVAKYWVRLLSQTKLGDQLPMISEVGKLVVPIDQVPGTVLP